MGATGTRRSEPGRAIVSEHVEGVGGLQTPGRGCFFSLATAKLPCLDGERREDAMIQAAVGALDEPGERAGADLLPRLQVAAEVGEAGELDVVVGGASGRAPPPGRPPKGLGGPGFR